MVLNNNCNSLAKTGSMSKYFILTLFVSLSVMAHEENLEEISVIEAEDSQGLVDFVPSIKKIKGPEITKRRQTSLGDTLSSEAGVQSTNFGPSSSRPVIRGQEGDRIKILQNSLGTLDASTQSLDHAIPVDVLTIDQMELVRGPMSLLYGSSAVGGVVNLVTNRIHYEYEEGFFSKFFLQGETVNRGLSSAAHLNYGVNKWMFHFDGSTRNLGDVSVPGYARTPDVRNSDPRPGEKKGKIENSFNKQDNVAVAASKIFDRGYVGMSFNHFNTDYGTVVERDAHINMTQNRAEVHAEYRPEGGTVRKFKFKTTQSDYFHKEIANGETGTTFKNKGNETRVEGITSGGNWNGVTGVQTQIYDFSANGEEAFLPSSQNDKIALFTFQQLSLGKNAYRLAGRLENSSIEKKSSPTFGAADEKGFLGLNGSVGHCYDFSKKLTLETSLSYTERAPTFQELYANGEHVAIGIIEKGDSHLRKEKSEALEVTLKNTTEKNLFTGSLYTQVFKDYIALNPTGVVTGGINEYAYKQVDALFYGIDLDNRNELKKLDKGALFFLTRFDYVRAKDTDSGYNLPRISPARLTLGFEYGTDKWNADLESQYVAQQTKTAPNESRTDDYILTNLGYTYKILGNLTSLELFARVRNIFNVEARSHVSTLKDIAPLPGRNLIVGAQFQF